MTKHKVEPYENKQNQMRQRKNSDALNRTRRQPGRNVKPHSTGTFSREMCLVRAFERNEHVPTGPNLACGCNVSLAAHSQLQTAPCTVNSCHTVWNTLTTSLSVAVYKHGHHASNKARSRRSRNPNASKMVPKSALACQVFAKCTVLR